MIISEASVIDYLASSSVSSGVAVSGTLMNDYVMVITFYITYFRHGEMQYLITDAKRDCFG